MLVGYLGPKGSFTHDVATHSFPTSERIAYRTITDVIKAYENQEIDFAVVPVENSIEGSVHETLDYLFHQGDDSGRCRSGLSHQATALGG